MAPKLMPHQQGTDEANIRLADVARNRYIPTLIAADRTATVLRLTHLPI